MQKTNICSLLAQKEVATKGVLVSLVTFGSDAHGHICMLLMVGEMKRALLRQIQGHVSPNLHCCYWQWTSYWSPHYSTATQYCMVCNLYGELVQEMDWKMDLEDIFFSHTTLVPPPPAWIRISASAFGHAVEIIHCWGAAVARAAEFPPSRALLDAQLCWLVLSPPRHNTAGDTSRGRGGRTESKAACSYTTTWHTLDATLYCMPTTNFVI